MPKKKKLYTATFSYEGKRYYVRSVVSQREADRKAAKKEAEMREGTHLVNGDMLVDDYFRRWVETYKKNAVSGPVYQSYLARYRIYISPHIGFMRMCDVRPIHCQAIMNACKMSHSLADKVLVCLKAMFRQAVEDDIIRKSPANSAKKAKLKKEKGHRSITEEERAAILAAAKEHPFGMFVKIMLYCGLRPQEVCVLEPTDIDVINRRIMVRRALKNDGTIAETKTDAGSRNIPIPQRLWENSLLDALPLRTVNGKFFSRANIQRNWASFLQRVNLNLGAKTDGEGHAIENLVAPDLELYCLRHTYCTDLEAAGVPINVAKYLMGHSDISMTARIYTHMREDTLAQATEKINKFDALMGATVGVTQNTYFTPECHKDTEIENEETPNKSVGKRAKII